MARLVRLFDGRVHVDAQSLLLVRAAILFEQLWIVKLNPVAVLRTKYRIDKRFDFVYCAIGAFAKFANLFKHRPTEVQLFLSVWARVQCGGWGNFRGHLLQYKTFALHWRSVQYAPQLPSILMCCLIIISTAVLLFCVF